MAKGKLILICQSGGEFVTNDDGTMSYNGGEANAANVTSETPFSDLKLHLAETCNIDQETATVKYFLPGNKRNLITVKNDKDVKRMIDFHGDAITAEVFVTGTPGFNRENHTKNDETENDDNMSTKKHESVKRGKAGTKKDKQVKKDYASPVKRTRRALAAAAVAAAASAEASSDEKAEGNTNALVSDDAKSESSTTDTSTSSDSERANANVDSESSSDYVPSRYPKRKKDSVKKRRRTPSWKFGANGRPTIVSDDSVGSKSRGKRRKTIDGSSGGRKSQRKSGRLAAKGDGSRETKLGRKKRGKRAIMPVADSSDEEYDDHGEPSALAMCDDDVTPETLVAVWKSAITGVGQEFTSFYAFREALQKYAMANAFAYKFTKNDTSRAIGECATEGCSWKFSTVWVPTTQSFKIKTLNDVHTCDEESRKSAYPTKNWLIDTIKEKLQKSPHLKPKAIANRILRDSGFELNRTPIRRGSGIRRKQLHGSDKDAYNKLPWFCEKIIETNPGSISKLVVGENKRFKALFMSVLEVFGDAHVGYSIYHLLQSFKRNVRGPFNGDGKGFLLVHFLAAAHAVRLVGFRKATEQIKQISSQAYDWVMQIEAQHWTTSSFKGERYNHITDDIGRSLAKLLDDYRELPILHKIEALICTMIDAINDAKLDASMWSTHLTPSKEKKLQDETVKSCGLKVLISSDILFEVREDSTHVVNLSNWSCTCFGWKETGLPCRHALAVFTLTGKSPYDFCSGYFTVAAYALTYTESITPVPIEEEKGEKIKDLEEKGEKIEDLEEKGEKIEGLEEKGEKVEGLEEKSEKVEGLEENGEKVEGLEENGEKVEGLEENGEKVEGLEEKGETVEGLDEKGENIGDLEEKGKKIEDLEEKGEKINDSGENGEKMEIKYAESEKEEAGGKEDHNDKTEKHELEGEEDEHSNVAEKEKSEIAEEKSEKIEMENAGGDNEETEKAEDQKEEIEKDEDDPDVFVLPPIPTKPADSGKEKMEWDEIEGETKRTVTCTKCKQQGHNKKSCNFYQMQQAF
ncbi:Phox/Bem1p, partial [Cynara cardunculus var. scolymus]